MCVAGFLKAVLLGGLGGLWGKNDFKIPPIPLKNEFYHKI
ncbi:hypothetical protein N408_03800 [Helicobacter pylori FD703]|nr:hypothetical protein N408_03800 [Helicobacter pylori FD703]